MAAQRVRGGVDSAEDDKTNKSKYQANYDVWRETFEKYQSSSLDEELRIWKATRFFTSGMIINLFIELLDILERLEIPTKEYENEFKIKFDVTAD